MDDSKATNVDATYTGLMGLKGKKSLILLGGIAKVTVEFWWLNINFIFKIKCLDKLIS